VPVGVIRVGLRREGCLMRSRNVIALRSCGNTPATGVAGDPFADMGDHSDCAPSVTHGHEVAGRFGRAERRRARVGQREAARRAWGSEPFGTIAFWTIG
jgi:hypothetical protein